MNMSKVIYSVLIMLAAFAPTVYAQKEKAGGKVDGAVFKFTKGETHDFGKVKKGPVAEHTFEFMNVGNQPLIVMDVLPSCSCTKVEWDKQPILPGQKGHITLGVKTGELDGVFNKSVAIRSNAVVPNGEKRYIIYLKGETVEK